MSFSLDSWESIINVASLFYSDNLPTYYHDDYIDIIVRIIQFVINVHEDVKFYWVDVDLREPLISHSKLNMIILSRPTFAEMINEKIDFIDLKIKHEETFDVFKVFGTIKYERENFSCVGSQTEKLTKDKEAKIIILIRIILIVQHWKMHEATKTTQSFSHEDFHPIELANNKNKIILE